MYTSVNFQTKKDLKIAVLTGQRIRVYQPGGLFDAPRDGTVSVEGPHFPKPHNWYAEVELKNGVVVRVK